MQKTRKILRIGITIGDINGIGPELIINAFKNQRLKEICTPIVYGSPRVLNIYRKILSVDKFSYNVIQQPNQAQPRKISVIDCIADLNDRMEIGKPDTQSGRAAYEALERAMDDLKSDQIDALVTMPIDKSVIQSDDFNFPGHTEYLTKQLDGKESLMFMVHDHLKIGVVTGHVPLKDVSKKLTVDGIVKKVQLMHDSLKLDFSVPRPRIAVMGLNPHAGDNGLLGKEEKEKISKAIEKCANKRMLVFGPYSADGFFGTGMFKRFDGVLAMYHDQGLIPFKLMAGFEGVNFTAGLSKVRTSPDHGPAFDLVGKNEASPTSFIHALYAAIDIHRRRRENQALFDNSMDKAKPVEKPARPERPAKGERKASNEGKGRNEQRRPEIKKAAPNKEQAAPAANEEELEPVEQVESPEVVENTGSEKAEKQVTKSPPAKKEEAVVEAKKEDAESAVSEEE